jgi:hypothetical protein
MRITNTDGKKAQAKLDRGNLILKARSNEEKLVSLVAEYKRANNRLEASKHAVKCHQSDVDALKQAMFFLVGEIK